MLLLLRQCGYEQNALEKGIYLNGKYTNLGVGKDVLYTEAEENRIKMKISDESTMLSAEYGFIMVWKKKKKKKKKFFFQIF